MPDPSLENLARATGKQPDELAHLLVCNVCTPSHQCDNNPALIRAALAAYRGQAPSGPAVAPDSPHVRYNRRGEAEVGDVDEFRRIRAQHTTSPIGNPAVVSDPRKK